MSWMDALKYGKAIADKKHEQQAEKPALPAQDMNLPFGGRIGGILTLQKSPFISALSAGSLLPVPAGKNDLIQSISRVKLDGVENKLYRYYLDTGNDGNGETFLQLYTDANGKALEAIYYTHLLRVIPDTIEEQDLYTGAEGEGLGERLYTLSREQIAETGKSEADLARIFSAVDNLEYTREVGGEADFCPPFHGEEKRLDDASGEHGLQQEVFYMPYSRLLGDSQKELLLIETEVVSSLNGEAYREIHVDFMVGLPLELDRISLV